ncbi:outer membrane lipoprotein-sorting protein [Candidatus Acetothermia bacterium]|nr:outer membrane lipoprotein-sorting protein [Candidatus Acetothermia bacterium]
MTKTVKIAITTFSLLSVAILFSLGPAYSQGSLTGQQILEKIDARGNIGGNGSSVSFSSFDIVDKSGSKRQSNFVFFGKGSPDAQVPNRVLIFFLAPPAETCGTIFLSIDKKIAGKKSDLYLYLPALGQAKQLVTSSDRKGSFAGSNLSFDQIGRSQLHTDFDAQLVGEETLKGITINGAKQDRVAYVLQLTANKTNNPDESFPQRKIWVDKQEFITLKSEDTNTVGKLQNMTTLDNLTTFKGRLETNLIKVTNVLDNSSTTVNISDREDIGDLADTLFDSSNLSKFEPKQFNDKLKVKVPDPTCK